MQGPTSNTAAATGTSLIHPLDEFYEEARLTLPRFEVISGADMPEPYRQLLVHQSDMTPTLQAFHGESIYVKALQREHRGDFYFRQVLLFLEKRHIVVEFGAIKI